MISCARNESLSPFLPALFLSSLFKGIVDFLGLPGILSIEEYIPLEGRFSAVAMPAAFFLREGSVSSSSKSLSISVDTSAAFALKPDREISTRERVVSERASWVAWAIC